MTSLRILALAAAAVTAVPAADPLVHASELALQARERSRLCHVHDAFRLLDAAIRETGAVPGDTAATLLARLEAERLDLGARSREFQNAQRDAKRLLAAARVESAAARLAAYPECAPEEHAEIERRRVAARAWTQRGGSAASVDAPGFYRQAALEDCEMPGLAAALENARRRAAELPCRGCAISRRVVLGVALAGGLGAGAYYGYRYWERRQHRLAGAAY
ncbi:MAG: hypothetical protein LAP87_18440 [Acidobacteriia bacterium]|nr:hypothetical protein [Terriglobia bacterium]